MPSDLYPQPKDDRRKNNPRQALCPECGRRMTLVGLKRWSHTQTPQNAACAYKGLPITRQEYTDGNPNPPKPRVRMFLREY